MPTLSLRLPVFSLVRQLSAESFQIKTKKIKKFKSVKQQGFQLLVLAILQLFHGRRFIVQYRILQGAILNMLSVHK